MSVDIDTHTHTHTHTDNQRSTQRRRAPRRTFSKVLSTVILYRKSPRTLTFQNIHPTKRTFSKVLSEHVPNMSYMYVPNMSYIYVPNMSYKVLSTVISHSKYTGALTFQNLRPTRRHACPGTQCSIHGDRAWGRDVVE